MLSTNDIRSKFLNFFKSKNHTIVQSDSLVPKDDPTVLFTTAGMQQFKPQFLGRDLTYTRATTAQKCLRTDDLDCVGKTDFHHTFFEMLGNFSFGDYFKKESIAWAWEFLTVELKLPKEKLWVSVYQEDMEAYDIWVKDIRFPLDRIVKLGDKSNFWPSNARVNGPNGPCGPCSEIFYDYGVNPECSKGAQCDPDCSCGRFSEIWNLVFTQFNRKEGGILEPLPAKNIDTGMGLERLVAVVQGKKSNYETDIFAPILNEIKLKIAGISEMDARIVADHMRAIVFGICDGVIPSNEGRGYIMKKLIIITSDIAVKYGVTTPLIAELSLEVIKNMKDAYPELSSKQEEIKRIEEGYLFLIKETIPRLKEEFKAALHETTKEQGDIVFKYRDTFGLMLETIRDVVSQLGVDENKWKEINAYYLLAMEEQQQRSRAHSKMTGDVFANAGIDVNVPKTKFLGYEQLEASARILQIVKDGMKVKVILEATPFYAQSGGQMGDAGVLLNDQASIFITDTHKINDVFVHDGVIEHGNINVGDIVKARVDITRRQAIMRHHSATHLLQSALRLVLGAHVKQQGSLVAPDRLRFDFSHPKGVKPEEIAKIESMMNGYIAQGDTVNIEVLPIEEAKKKGALAFFAEKYGETVRVVTMGNYSTEFCGGTHVSNTKDIEVVKIVSEGSVAQGIRRIEAVTGMDSVNKINAELVEQQAILDNAQKLKQAQVEQQKLQFETIKLELESLIKHKIPVKGMNVITHTSQNLDIAHLRKLSDFLKVKLTSGIFILGNKTADDAAIVLSISDDLVQRGFKANEMLAKAATIFEGNGGGKPQLAQAGSKNPQKLDDAILALKEMITQ